MNRPSAYPRRLALPLISPSPIKGATSRNRKRRIGSNTVHAPDCLHTLTQTAGSHRLSPEHRAQISQIIAEKGLIRRDESQRAHVYEAARALEWTQQRLVGDLLERAFAGSAKALVLGALSARKASGRNWPKLRLC